MNKVEIPAGKRRCNQCNEVKPLESGFRQSGRRYKVCNDCRYRAAHGAKVENYRTGLRTVGPEPVVGWVRISSNRKLGRIPVSMTSSETCPRSCAWFNAGCFGEFSFQRHWWRRVPEHGLRWGLFVAKVRRLPAGQIWRHNEVGDLPGEGESLRFDLLMDLVRAARHTRGFTFEADRMLAIPNAPPVTALIPEGEKRPSFRSPAGNMVTVCPAFRAKITCDKCQICTHPTRKGIVAFSAHGNLRKVISLRLKGDSA